MLREIVTTFNTRSFAALIATGFFIALGSGIGSSLSLYWTLYVYQFSQAQMSLLVAPVMLGTLATGIAPVIAKPLGKRNAAILLSWIYVVTSLVPLIVRITGFLPAKSPLLFGLVMIQTAVTPAAMTMVLIMLGSMISDLVEDAEVRTGRRSEGLLLAANSFVRKATQGLGTLGAGIILMLSSFPEGAERKDVPETILLHLILLYIVVTILLFIGTTISLRLYRVNRGAHEENLKILAERAALSDREAGGADTAPDATEHANPMPPKQMSPSR
jgi:Na+/melibiose symporter-like transporter